MTLKPNGGSPPAGSLLDLDPRLGNGISAPARERARRELMVPTLTIPPGPWDPAGVLGDNERSAFGLLVVDGLLLRDVLIADTVTTELLGAGDLLPRTLPDELLIPLDVRWASSAPTRVAVLDHRLLDVLERWPTIAAGLIRRASLRAARMSTARAISQLPRIEQRLLALFWHLAERWGRVGTAGVIVPLALTHELLGRLVGARRPTVSLALKELAASGTVTRRPDGGWLLRPGSAVALTGAGSQGYAASDAALIPDDPPSAAAYVGGGARAMALSAADIAAVRARVEALSDDIELRRDTVTDTLARVAATRERAAATRAVVSAWRRRP